LLGEQLTAVDPHVARFRDLRDRGVEALRGGDLREALACFDRAAEAAHASGDTELVDLAGCNRAAIQIELGESRTVLADMRAVLLRSRNPQTCMVAATNAARIHDLAKDYKKGLFYARLARDHAEVAGDASQLASVRNLQANLLLAESHVEDAAREYEAALETMPEEDPVWRARALGNLGYCRVLQRRLSEAFSLLRRATADLRDLEADFYLVAPLTDLAFAHLEADQPQPARDAAEEALALAREHEDESGTKNALYLLGEAAGMLGDVPTARRCFLELQQRYYPDKPFVCDFLLSVDVRKIVNLRA
jgi:tetratricopeptide (TPR) repeat protein